MQGSIWLGQVNGGFFKLNENKDFLSLSTFTNFSDKVISSKEAQFRIRAMAQKDEDEILLINNQNKLLRFNINNKTSSIVSWLDSSLDYSFTSLLVSDDNDIWLGSFNGLYQINLEKSNLTVYYGVDGLQGDRFLGRSVFKDEKGLLYFGGTNGMNFFDPKNMEKQSSSAKLNISAIEILNQPLDSMVPANKVSGLNNIRHLDLKYNQSSFSFKFSAIDNILNPKYYYAYRLKGFNDDWITSSSDRIATYTNIPSGDYLFEVKAGSKKGTWDVPVKQISIRVDRPIWQKPIAYVIYFILLGLLAYGFKRWYSLRKKLQMEKIINIKENELHNLKMNFFTKMSHEIQTPITLILGPINDMISNAEQNGDLLYYSSIKIPF